jgi:hypothetical protein
MPVYAKMRGNSLVLPSASPSSMPLGSLYVNGANTNVLTFRTLGGVDLPIFGGTLTSSEVLNKRKLNSTLSTISADKTIALKTDGTICLADSDDLLATNVIGVTKEDILAGQYGVVQIIGPSAPNVIDGLGFTTGDIIYLGDTAGSLTNDIGSIVGAVKVVGIADCPSDDASSIATDLIMVNGEGSGGGGSVTITASATILRGYPVSVTALGQATVVDITNEDSVYAFCGVTSVDCLIGGTANILTAGSVLLDIPAAFGLTGQWGKHVFVSHSGTFTITKPEVGVGGFLSEDFIVSVGVTTKNTATGTTDLILNPTVRGRLA